MEKSHDFVLESYKITENYPKQELFGLVSQLRRAVVSISANITEGYKRKGKTEKLRFFKISQCISIAKSYMKIYAHDNFL